MLVLVIYGTRLQRRTQSGFRDIEITTVNIKPVVLEVHSAIGNCVSHRPIDTAVYSNVRQSYSTGFILFRTPIWGLTASPISFSGVGVGGGVRKTAKSDY